jgi:pyrroline-5-carboxylate reductase
MQKIALIGGGRMGQSMMEGWLKQSNEIEVSLFDPVLNDEWAQKLSAANWHYNPQEAKIFDIIVIAVKPQSFIKIADEMLGRLVDEDSLIISIMAGINLAKLKLAAKANKICRAMPNTPGQIGAGITGIIGNDAINDKDYRQIEKLLAPLGEVVRLEREAQIDGVTAISGSGPAYIFYLAECLTKAGVHQGLDTEIAQKLAIETIYGAGLLMKQSGREPAELRAEVTSPNGTTQAALEILMPDSGLMRIIEKTVGAASMRSKELGK